MEKHKRRVCEMLIFPFDAKEKRQGEIINTTAWIFTTNTIYISNATTKYDYMQKPNKSKQ